MQKEGEGGEAEAESIIYYSIIVTEMGNKTIKYLKCV